MKAQRRHELRTNALARSLETFPEKLQRHLNKIIFGLAVAIIVFLLVRYRINAAATRQQELLAALANAQSEVTEMQSKPAVPEERKGIYDVILSNLATVDQEAADQPSVAAAALVARGDANLEMATAWLAVTPTTRPTDSMDQVPSDLLKLAEQAYNSVIDKYPTETLSVAAAHFGLGTIAEDRHQWTQAAAEYSAIANIPGVPDTIKAFANEKLQSLAQIQEPVYIGPPVPATTPSTAPTTTTAPVEPTTTSGPSTR